MIPPRAGSAASPRVRLVHFQPPGRARFEVEGLKRNRALAARLAEGLPEAPGIEGAEANPITGRVLVLFRPPLRTDTLGEAIERLLEGAAPPPAHPRGVPPAIPAPPAAGGAAAPAPPPIPWHSLPLDELFDRLGVADGAGLTAAQAARRLARHGPNLISEHPRRSELALLLGQFQSLPVALLGVSAVVALATGGVADAAVIGAVVAVNALIGFLTERQAEQVIASLGERSPRSARVVRDGEPRDLPARELVPGDRLLLAPGSYVPADLRLTEARRLTVDESALTGESLPVEKQASGALPAESCLAYRRNLLHMGTQVTGGSGAGVAVATGAATEIGRIQALIGEAGAPETPMQRQLGELGRQLVLISGAVCAGVFAIGLLRGQGLLPMLRSAVSLAVAALPEGLPAIATTTLALGIRRMRGLRLAVRHLDAVESLGAVGTFCLDKTGTLTRNRMRLTALRSGLAALEVGEAGLHCAGVRVTLERRPALRRLFEVMVLCNESESGEAGSAGSPTELALLEGAQAAGIDAAALRRALPRSAVQYRSEGRPYMKTVHDYADGRRLVAVKGSPAAVLALCDRVAFDGETRPLDEPLGERLLAENEAMAGEAALRVLALACTELEPGGSVSGARLTWLGLAGLSDPLRPGVAGLIREFHGAGIRTVMITGDQSATAYAIGRELKLAGDEEIRILDSAALEKLPPELLAGVVRNVQVFARVSPANKLMIVRALQQAGQVVAMTGDGINDGPALKAADVGVAMGSSGTDVARQVADVVVEDDRLETVVEAIRQGRTLYANIRKSVQFLLATNLSEIEVMVAGLALGLGQPLTPMQLLFINLVSDIFPGLALSLEPPEAEVLRRPPRDPREPIVRRRELQRIGGEATLLAAATLGSWLYALTRYGPGPRAGTHAFATLTIAQLLHALSTRSERHSLFEPGVLAPNPLLTAAVGGSLGLTALAMALPPSRRLLGLAPVGVVDALVIGAGACLPLLVNEFGKLRPPAATAARRAWRAARPDEDHP